MGRRTKTIMKGITTVGAVALIGYVIYNVSDHTREQTGWEKTIDKLMLETKVDVVNYKIPKPKCKTKVKTKVKTIVKYKPTTIQFGTSGVYPLLEKCSFHGGVSAIKVHSKGSVTVHCQDNVLFTIM